MGWDPGTFTFGWMGPRNLYLMELDPGTYTFDGVGPRNLHFWWGGTQEPSLLMGWDPQSHTLLGRFWWWWSLSSTVSCGVGHRCGSDRTLLWLWCRWAAVSLIQLVAWELPYAVGAALKSKKRKRKKEMLAGLDCRNCVFLTLYPWCPVHCLVGGGRSADVGQVNDPHVSEPPALVLRGAEPVVTRMTARNPSEGPSLHRMWNSDLNLNAAHAFSFFDPTWTLY